MPPAQIGTCPIRAYGSYLGWVTVKRVSRSGWIRAPCCARHPGRVTRLPGSESRACRPVSRFPRSPPLAPPTPLPVARLCSSASQLLSPSVTSHVRHRRLRLLTSGECVAFVRLHGPARRRSRPARHEISRFPKYRELTHMPGSPTTPDQSDARGDAPRLFCLPQRRRRRHPE